MTNFIELHMQDGSTIIYNISHIISIFPARAAAVEKYGYNCHIVVSNCGSSDTDNVKETYDQVIEKIKRCTSSLVVT